MKRKHLFILAALIWGIPGVSITLKGVTAYRDVIRGDLWWLLLITAATCIGFYFMFRRIVARYSERISSLPDKVNAFMTFPTRGWILLIFMMSLGITLKYIPGIPSEFTASFYCGLGPMLLLSAMKYCSNAIHYDDAIDRDDSSCNV